MQSEHRQARRPFGFIFLEKMGAEEPFDQQDICCVRTDEAQLLLFSENDLIVDKVSESICCILAVLLNLIENRKKGDLYCTDVLAVIHGVRLRSLECSGLPP